MRRSAIAGKEILNSPVFRVDQGELFVYSRALSVFSLEYKGAVFDAVRGLVLIYFKVEAFLAGSSDTEGADRRDSRVHAEAFKLHVFASDNCKRECDVVENKGGATTVNGDIVHIDDWKDDVLVAGGVVAHRQKFRQRSFLVEVVFTAFEFQAIAVVQLF